MRALERVLARERGTVMDGGMGSTVEDRGIDVRNALWGSIALLSAGGRAINDRVHAEFVAAGAELLIANTHNASFASCFTFVRERSLETFEDRALAESLQAVSGRERALRLLEHVNRAALASARAAGAPAVAAGVGSAEGAYATSSRIGAERVVELLRPQVSFLDASAPDVIIFETLSTASELAGVASLSRELATPFAVGLTCGADARTLAGVSMEDVARAFEGSPPLAWFVQCTRYDLVAPALAALARAVPRGAVLGAYGNDGRVWRDRRWIGERISPEAYARAAEPWRDLGARIIGGCCGTGPEHIAALGSLW